MDKGESETSTSEATTKQEAIETDDIDILADKYISGEVRLDNYQLLLEEECLSQSTSAKQPQSDSKLALKRTKKVSPYIQSLMGEANIRFARGDIETATKMCLEVIRNAPRYVEPYLTLAQIYEIDNPALSLQYNMVAAFLKPSDVHLWVHLAQLSLSVGDNKQAITCYTNAIHATPRNADLHWKRIELLELLGDTKNVQRFYMRLLNVLEPEQHDLMLSCAIKLAKEYHTSKEYAKAIEALDVPFKKCPKLITLELVNVMLELLLLNGNYSYCLDIFLEYCNIEIEVFVLNDNKLNIISYNMPSDLQIDLRMKFIICVIKLEAFHLLNELIEPIIAHEDVEIVGDLYLDVTEVLMSANRHEDALKLLVPLVKSKNFSLAAVWLKYADCLSACQMHEHAIESYHTVIQMAPQHHEVKINLANSLLKMHKTIEAMDILNQDPNLQEIDVGVLLKRINLLEENEFYDEYWKSVELLLSRHCTIIKHVEEIRAVTYLERPSEKMARIQKLRKYRGETVDQIGSFDVTNEPIVDEEYKLFRHALELCMNRREYAIMQKLVFTALSSTRFKNKYDELHLLGFITCMFNKDSYHGYSLIREIVIHNRKNNLAWNLFNVFLQGADDVRHNRFMMRFLSSFANSIEFKALAANYALTVGNFRLAMTYYMRMLRVKPDPLWVLLLGVTVLQIYCQRFTKRKSRIINITMGLFMHYAHMRGKDAHEEIQYNLARMYQQFGVIHLAKHYYELVLAYDNPLAKKHESLSLKQEAAYNLHIIFKDCGNEIAARNVLLKYIRI